MFAAQLQRIQTPLQAWHFADETMTIGGVERVVSAQEKMLDAVSTLIGQGWRGAVTPNGDGTCKVELNADNPSRTVSAGMGDWLVIDFDLRALSDDQCAAEYEAAQG